MQTNIHGASTWLMNRRKLNHDDMVELQRRLLLLQKAPKNEQEIPVHVLYDAGNTQFSNKNSSRLGRLYLYGFEPISS